MYRSALLALLSLTGPALGQEVDCATAMVQVEMNYCAEQDWQAADADLNAAYQETLAQMQAIDAEQPPDLQGAEAGLRKAQRAWIEYRDANCAVAGFPMRGGSAEALLIYGCLRQMTINRTEELQSLVEAFAN